MVTTQCPAKTHARRMHSGKRIGTTRVHGALLLSRERVLPVATAGNRIRREMQPYIRTERAY